MKNRIEMVFIFCFLFWAGLIFRASYLQLLPHEKFENLIDKKFKTSLTIKTRRGAILDRNEEVLATTVSTFSLFADPKLIKNPRKVSKQLSKLLKIPKQKIYKKIKPKTKRFVWLKRQLSKEMKEEIQKIKERGLGFIREPKRMYPNGALLSQVIGLVGRDGQGLEGLELKYDSYLMGKEKKLSLRRDARGRPLFIRNPSLSDYEGANLHLTIDSELQFVLERELSRSVKKYKAKSAVGVVLDRGSFEVLAMANIPKL